MSDYILMYNEVAFPENFPKHLYLGPVSDNGECYSSRSYVNSKTLKKLFDFALSCKPLDDSYPDWVKNYPQVYERISTILSAFKKNMRNYDHADFNNFKTYNELRTVAKLLCEARAQGRKVNKLWRAMKKVA